jgi:hypothetical protein
VRFKRGPGTRDVDLVPAESLDPVQEKLVEVLLSQPAVSISHGREEIHVRVAEAKLFWMPVA